MSFLDLLLLCIVLGFLVAGACVTTGQVWHGSTRSKRQRIRQILLIWVVPVFGLLVVRAVLSHQAELSGRGRYLFGDDHPGQSNYLGGPGNDDGGLGLYAGGGDGGCGGHGGADGGCSGH
jgi:hypothetical protein